LKRLGTPRVNQTREARAELRNTADMSSSKLVNVLVLLATDGKNVIVRDHVSACLHPDKYAVRNIALTELLRSPWEETTKAVIVPSPGGSGPEELALHEVNRLQRYCKNGGKILSMHPQLNNAFGFPFPSIEYVKANSIVVLHCRRHNESDSSFLECSAPLCSITSVPRRDKPLWSRSSQFITTALCTTPAEDTPIICALHEVDESTSCSSGVLSYADLFPDLKQFASDPAVLQSLKETWLMRKKLLCVLLEQLDLHCHSVDTPSHSLSYLLSSSPVSRQCMYVLTVWVDLYMDMCFCSHTMLQ